MDEEVTGECTGALLTSTDTRLAGAYDALIAYRRLSTARRPAPTALLETACIRSREHTQSMLMLSAALKIECRDARVGIEALNSNGGSALDILSAHLPCFYRQDDVLLRDFSDEGAVFERDEQKRLLDIACMQPLRQLLHTFSTGQGEDDHSTMLFGCFNFELFSQFEQIGAENRPQQYPHFEFYLADQLLFIDHQQASARLVYKVFNGAAASVHERYRQQMAADHEILLQSVAGKKTTLLGGESHTGRLDYTTSLSDEEYAARVEVLKGHIRAGDVFQAVLARQFSLRCAEALAAYQVLRQHNPSPYMFFIDTADYQLFGASPESAVKVTAANRQISLYPIAGTRPRGLADDGTVDLDLDSRMEAELRMDVKEGAEHMMLVDLARNDVARISKPGSRHLQRLLDVDRYSHVMHLVSKVVGELRNDVDCFTAYRACMNMGTLTGAPKVRATQLIARYEGFERGPYGGAVGYINARGDMDTAIVIRSALIRAGVATVSAGAGIVFDSDPQAEADETRAKAMAVLCAIGLANGQRPGAADKVA